MAAIRAPGGAVSQLLRTASDNGRFWPASAAVMCRPAKPFEGKKQFEGKKHGRPGHDSANRDRPEPHARPTSKYAKKKKQRPAAPADR